MSLKRKRPTEEASQQSSSISELSSIASSNAEVPVPISDLATATANETAVDADSGAASIFSDRRVTNRTKTLVRIRENHKCWLCGFHGVHIAHVVARADAILLSAQGLLKPDFGFHGLPNLMLLCAGCHHNFDVRIPIWAFLPSDLQSFVDREREFHRLRAIAATNGICLQREHDEDKEVSPSWPTAVSIVTSQVDLVHAIPYSPRLHIPCTVPTHPAENMGRRRHRHHPAQPERYLGPRTGS